MGGVRCSRLWSTSQLLRPSGQHITSSSLFRIPEIYVALNEVAKVRVKITDRERVIFTDSLEKSRDVMIAILPSLLSSKIKRECNGCFTSHLSQTQHSCLEEVSEEDRTDRIKHVISQCTSGMIYMVFACNGRSIPSVDVEAVEAMYGTEIIEKQN